jgi:hypothetical protein
MPLRDTFPPSALHQAKIHRNHLRNITVAVSCALPPFNHSIASPSSQHLSFNQSPSEDAHHHRPAPPSCLHHDTVGLPRRPIRFAGKFIDSDTIFIRTGERGDSNETIGVKSKALLRCDQIPAHPYLNWSSLQHLIQPESTTRWSLFTDHSTCLLAQPDHYHFEPSLTVRPLHDITLKATNTAAFTFTATVSCY